MVVAVVVVLLLLCDGLCDFMGTRGVVNERGSFHMNLYS